MKEITKNILIPAAVILAVCGIFILFFYNPIERANMKLEKFFKEKRDNGESKIYTRILMDKFVDDTFKKDIGDIDIGANIYIYEDEQYKYMEVIPEPDYINSYHIAFDKKNDLAIFSNYGEAKGEEVVRYYINKDSVSKIYVAETKVNITIFTDIVKENYKVKEVLDCYNYYINYAVK